MFENPCELCGWQNGTGTGCPLSLPFHQWSVVIFIYMLVLSKGQAGNAWWASKKECCFGNRCALDSRVLSISVWSVKCTMWPDTWSVTCSLLQRWLSSTKTAGFQRTLMRLKPSQLFHLYTYKHFLPWKFMELLKNYRMFQITPSSRHFLISPFVPKGRPCTVLLILLIVVITTGCILLHNL